MRFVIEAIHLKKILKTVKGCVPDKSTMPILSCVLLRASDGFLFVSGINMEREATASAPAQMDHDGSVAVPGKILCEIAENLHQGAQVGFELKGSRLHVTSGHFKSVLSVLEPKDFPSIAAVQSDAIEFSIGADVLAKLMGRTHYAASKNIMGQPGLYGVHFHPREDGKLAAVGFDSKRMALALAELPNGAETLKPTTVPTDAVPEVLRLLGQLGAANVTVRAGSLFQIETPDMLFTTKIMGQAYEKYEQHLKAIMVNSSEVAKVYPSALKEAVKRTCVVYSTGLSKYQTVHVELKEDGMVVSAGGGKLDDARDEIDAEVLDAQRSFHVNKHFLEESLADWPDNEEISISMLPEQGRPILLRSVKDASILHFIAPHIGQASVAGKEAA